MATVISSASGNLTASGTWKLASSTAEVDSEAFSNLNISTGNSTSATFVPANTAVDGVAIKVAAIINPTGTLTVSLVDSTTSTTKLTVTINASDLNTLAAGWYVFTGTPFTPNGTDSYTVVVTRSVADSATNRISLFTSSTGSAANMSREVRHTTNQAPAAGDKIIISGEMTSAGTQNVWTVTMDSTAATSYGPTVSGGPPQGVTVNAYSTFQCGTTATTAYIFKWKGILQVNPGGTMTVGTSGTPVPSGSTADWIMDPVANVDTGIVVATGATFTTYGAVSGGTLTPWTLLTADYSSGTSISVSNGTVNGIQLGTTGWAVGDTLGFAPTGPGTSNNQQETQTIASGITATGCTLTSGLAHSHSGTSPTQGEVVNLSRNVRIHGTSTTLCGYLLFQGTATVTQYYTEHYNLGSGTATKEGCHFSTTGGTQDIEYCSYHDFFNSNAGAALFSQIGNYSGLTWQHNVGYNLPGYFAFFTSNASTIVQFTFNDCVYIGPGAGGGIASVRFFFLGANTTITNIRVAGSGGDGFSFELGAAFISGQLGTCNNLTAHTNGSVGIALGESLTGTLSTLTCWRNSGAGISFAISGGLGLTLNTVTCFGNTLSSIAITQQNVANVTIIGLASNGDTTQATTNGIVIGSGATPEGCWNFAVENANFSNVSGILTAHTNDVNILNANYQAIDIVFRNVTCQANTLVNNLANVPVPSRFSFECFARSGSSQAGTAGNHLTIRPNGSLYVDQNNFHTAAPSLAIWPNNTTAAANGYTGSNLKIDSSNRRGGWFVPVANGGTVTASAWTRKSQASDTGGTCTTSGTTVTWASGKLFSSIVPQLSAPTQSVPTPISGGSLSSGTTYYWVITALNGSNETVISNEKSLAIVSPNQTASLSWNAITNATAYKVYRSTTSGTYTGSALVTTITSGATNYYDTGTATTAGAPPASNGTGLITINGTSYAISSVTNDKTLVLTTSAGTQASPVTFGQLYNGNQQRLIVKRNNAMGITADTVLATAAAAAGTWEQLSGTTAAVTDDGVLEFVLDCDGTTGWVNVDDFSATPTVSTGGLQFWLDGDAFAAIQGSGGSAGMFYTGGMTGGCNG